MPIGSHLKKLCRKCGQLTCICIFSIGLSAVLPHIYQAEHLDFVEQPHTERHMDTRNVREFPKISIATPSPHGSLFQVSEFDAPWGTTLRLSGFRRGATSPVGKVTEIVLKPGQNIIDASRE